MSRLGMGAMLHRLAGGSERSAEDFYGRRISAAEKTRVTGRWDGDEMDALVLTFEDGTKAVLTDQGQSCCEARYMTCDDDLSKLVGGTLVNITTASPEPSGEDYSVHEQVFVEIATDRCFVTVCTHNEHNGYYGGFGLNLAEVVP